MKQFIKIENDKVVLVCENESNDINSITDYGNEKFPNFEIFFRQQGEITIYKDEMTSDQIQDFKNWCELHEREIKKGNWQDHFSVARKR